MTSPSASARWSPWTRRFPSASRRSPPPSAPACQRRPAKTRDATPPFVPPTSPAFDVGLGVRWELCDGLDFYQLIAVAEHGDAQQGAGDVVAAHVLQVDVPRRDQVLLLGGGDIDRGFDDVGKRGPGP